MVEAALAESARFGRSKTLHAPERTLRLGQKRRPAAEGNCDAPPAIGAPVVETACDATEFAFARSVAAADRSGEERSRTRFQFRQDSICPTRIKPSHATAFVSNSIRSR